MTILEFRTSPLLVAGACAVVGGIVGLIAMITYHLSLVVVVGGVLAGSAVGFCRWVGNDAAEPITATLFWMLPWQIAFGYAAFVVHLIWRVSN